MRIGGIFGVCVLGLAGFAGSVAQAGEAGAQPRRGIGIDARCDVESDYDFHLTERSVVFTRKAGSPHTVLVRDGRLFVDDRWVEVSAADSRRLRDYEREARATMPLAQDIGREASQIAFTAIGEVAAGFSRDPERTRQMLAQARDRVDARIAESVNANRFSGDELGQGIGGAIEEVMPTLLADIAGGAVSTVVGAAFGARPERLRRLENLDAEIEALVQPRAKALERKAERLCRRMEALDAIDNALEYRLPDGRPLALLELKPVESGKD